MAEVAATFTIESNSIPDFHKGHEAGDQRVQRQNRNTGGAAFSLLPFGVKMQSSLCRREEQ